MERYSHLVAAGRKLLVYVPPSYRTAPDTRYPVAYVQDGGELFDSCVNQLEHLFRQGKLQETIFVGVASPNRNDDYTPWPAEALQEGKPSFGGGGRAYVDELADIVKPYIDGIYRTLPEAGHTAIIGGSLGGLVAMFAGYWRPDAFGRLGLLSPSLWYDGALRYVEEQPALASSLRVFMSVGSCEGMYKQNAQRHMVPHTKRAYAAWMSKDEDGGHANRLRFIVSDGDTHDLLSMARRLPEALAWLFPSGRAEERSAQAALADAAIERMTYTIPGTDQWVMRAARTGREYRIYTYVPPGPPPGQGYPVLYSLDGNASFGSLAEAMRLQARPPHGFEPGIVVGIGYDSDEPIVSERRFYDYTEKADPAKLPERPNRAAWPETGGADGFLAFIEEELKPAMERRFPIDRERQSLFGHSLGGWFALHALAERPEAFSAYIAGSPSIWWNGSAILDRLPHALRRLQESAGLSGMALYIGMGADEKPSMKADAERLHALLQPCRAGGLRLHYRAFEGEGHVSVVHPMISDMLRFTMRREGERAWS
ncbi:alpha/beta hydrolase [Paenibacillus lycopersici]|uniref:Alpha/beta hydrolase n=1 Tax=Paenibacillus lycopersici TaxID=2704462 RepID=A0A6C0FTA7_9BACL|nr:alpha/beta hydrolase-fold protein [Paenibacillus lycopersici]QHT58563.1 alpha/beta hydrolase [Paenibacillus lycopersici]